MKQVLLNRNEITKKRRKYQINPSFFILKDEKSVSYHVEKNDYFGTLATIISLLMQNLKAKDTSLKNRMLMIKTLKNLEKDLILLQKNYTISIKPLKQAKNKKQENNTKRQAKKPVIKKH